MATNTDIAVNSLTWTELTNADATSISTQNKGPYPVMLKATTGAAPTDETGAILLPNFSMFVNETLANLWPGATGAVRVFAKAQAAGGTVMVSHA